MRSSTSRHIRRIILESLLNCAASTSISSILSAIASPNFTPGDNDWTDCDRPSNGPFSSFERLDHAREVFFSTLFRWVSAGSNSACRPTRCASVSPAWSRVSRTDAGPWEGSPT